MAPVQLAPIENATGRSLYSLFSRRVPSHPPIVAGGGPRDTESVRSIAQFLFSFEFAQPRRCPGAGVKIPIPILVRAA